MDNAIYPYRLAECGLDVVDGMHHAGKADKCGGCDKPFHAARKWHSVARATFMSDAGEVHSWSWLLCRKCGWGAKLNGNKTPPHLLRQAHEEMRLLVATPGGKA